MTLIKTLAAAFCVVALLPAASADASIRVYKVTAEGTGSFTYDLSLPSGDGLGLTTHRNVAFGWKVQLPSVAFLSNGEGVPVSNAATAQGQVTGNATEETTIVGSDGKGGKVTTHGFCEAKDSVLPVTAASITPDPFTGDSNAGGANITVNPLAGLAFPANCTAAIYGGHGQLSVDVDPKQFEQRFNLPTEATRQGKIIQLVDATPAQRNKCSATVAIGDCAFDWHGTLTFEFTGYLGEGELTPEDLPELPAGGGAQPGQPQQPAQPGQPGQPDPDDDLIVPLPTGGKLARDGSSASVKVTCAAACAGTVRAFPAGGSKASAAAARPLASARFKARAGKPAKVTLRFPGAARRRVRSAKAVRLVVSTGKAKRTVVLRRR